MTNLRFLFVLLIPLISSNIFAQNVVQVAAGTDGITAAYTSATSGDIIELTSDGGLYIETTMLIVADKEITIRAASGLVNKPIWACTAVSAYGGLMQLSASITVDGIIMDGTGSTPATVNGIITEGASGLYNIKVFNSIFRNFNRAIYGSSSAQADSVIISNCLFEKFTAEAIMFYGQSTSTPAPGSFKYLSVTNSTFWNPTYLAFACIYTQANDLLYSPNVGFTPDPRVEIDHVTIYNFRRLYCNSHTNVQIKNIIFMNAGTTSATGILLYGDQTSISNSMYFNIPVSFTGGVVQTNLMNADPLFNDGTVGDFTISETSPAYNTGTDGKSLGDPRWWPKLSNAIYVEAGLDKISSALAIANPGDIIELITDGGVYEESTTLTVDKNITIQNSPSLINKPVWTSDDGGYLIRTKANLSLIGITLDGSKGTIKNVGGIATDSSGYNIRLTNCDFVNFINEAGTDGHAITDGIYSGKVDSFIISGCTFENIKKEGIYLAAHYIDPLIFSVKYFHLTNSTFSKISSDAIYVRDNDGTFTTPGQKFLIDHCTFNDCFAGYGILAHHIDGAVIKNCISYSSVNSGTTTYYIYGPNSILKNSLYYNLNINLHTAQSQNVINADPLFVDAMNGNFMLYKNSPAVNAGDDGTTIGDPRWGVSTLDFGKLVVVKKPYSMSPTTNSVKVVWQTPLNQSDSSIVEYGLTSALGETITGPAGWLIAGEGYMHEVTMNGLDPFTIYYYRVGNGLAFSDTCTTKTAPAPGTNFRLMIGGDSRDNPPVWEQICTSALKDSVDMSIHVGDYVTYSYDRTYGEEFFTPADVLNSKRPFIGVIGNHETEPGPGTTFYDYMSLPEHTANGENGESYFSMDYGDVKFIMVNSNGNFGESTNEEFATGSPQNIWLINELANNTSKWVFIVQHTPIISTSLHGQWTAEAKAYLMPLYESYAAEGKHIVVFNGDDHNFEHLYKAGVNHFRPAGGGASLYDTGLNSQDQPWSVYFNMVHNYSTVDVRSDGDTVIVQGHLPTGEIFYEVTLTTSGNQGPSIYIIEPDGKGDEVEEFYRITWADSDPDDDAKISLYYTPDVNLVGNLIVENISEDDPQNYFDWTVSNISPGSYYIYAIISDDTNPSFIRFSRGKVTVVPDTVAPPSVIDLNGTINEHNHILLTWTNPTKLIHVENILATFEEGFDGFIGENHGTSTGSLEIIPGITGSALRINYQITAAWDQYAGVKMVSGFPKYSSTPFLDFWYRGDGSSNPLRLIAKQDNDRNGYSDDWWYTEAQNLGSTEWKHAVVDLRSLQALSWHQNGDLNFDLENMASIDFIIPSATASSGHLDIDEVKLTGEISAAPDFVGVIIIRRTDRYPLNVTDGEFVYQGDLETCIDSTIGPGQMYYYSIFAFDEIPNYSALDSSAQWKSPLITGVKDENELPKEYELNQNYPNPFNPSTTIKYAIPNSGNVKLIVYNALGQEVAVLVNQVMEAGRYSVDFNPVSLSSGIYIYKIEADKFTSIKKMVFLK